MMNRPTSGYTSHKVLHFKEYLDSIRPKSKPRQQQNNLQSRCMLKSPPPKAEPETSQSQMLQLQHRYLELQSKYKELLQKARLRNMEHDRLKEQLQMYQKMHQRDTEHIEKLRCIIGLINRKNAQTQVNQEQIEWNQHLKNSRVNKFDQSTQDDIKFKLSSEKFHPKKSRVNKSEEWNFLEQGPPTPTLTPKARQSKESRVRPSSKQSRMRQSRQKTHIQTQSSSKGLLLQYQKELKKAASGVGRKFSNVPYSQLRYVPSFKK